MCFYQAEQLTFGSQLGWMDAGQAMEFLTRRDSADELNFTRTLVQLKEKYRTFLTTVRLIAKQCHRLDLVWLFVLYPSLSALILKKLGVNTVGATAPPSSGHLRWYAASQPQYLSDPTGQLHRRYGTQLGLGR